MTGAGALGLTKLSGRGETGLYTQRAGGVNWGPLWADWTISAKKSMLYFSKWNLTMGGEDPALQASFPSFSRRYPNHSTTPDDRHFSGRRRRRVVGKHETKNTLQHSSAEKKDVRIIESDRVISLTN